MKRFWVLFLIVLLAFSLAACGGGEEEADSGDTGDTTSQTDDNGDTQDSGDEDTESDDGQSDDEGGEEDSGAASGGNEVEMVDWDGESYSGPEWAELPLTNAVTGEEFKLSDFGGTVVQMELTSIDFCPRCEAKLDLMDAAQNRLNKGSYTFIILVLDRNATAESVATYAQDNDFADDNEIWAVITDDLRDAIQGEFGRAKVSANSYTHLLIAPDGQYGEPVTGSVTTEADIFVALRDRGIAYGLQWEMSGDTEDDGEAEATQEADD